MSQINDGGDVLDDTPLTEEELANLRPAREVLPESFFKAVERERRKRQCQS
jgi:hypothetical protein